MVGTEYYSNGLSAMLVLKLCLSSIFYLILINIFQPFARYYKWDAHGKNFIMKPKTVVITFLKSIYFSKNFKYHA